MNNRLKKLTSIVTAVFMVMTACIIPTVSISASTDTDVKWTEGVTGGAIYFDKSTGLITACEYGVTDVIIPKEIDGVPVTGIEAYTFVSNNLKSVTIPDSVTTIEDQAFWGCNSLTNITVAENNANYSSKDGVLFDKQQTVLIQYPIGNNRESYTIPSTVTTIKTAAFFDCLSLKYLTIPEGVTSIEPWAFYCCGSLTSLTIPEGVTSITENIVGECTSLTSITIPDSVTSIADYVFYKCSSLTNITVGENNANYLSKDGVLYDKQQTVLMQYPSGNNRKSYEIPNTVTTIKDYAFAFSSYLESITIPEGVTTIPVMAFSECSSLKSITIPEGVTAIDNYAFENCVSLTSVTIPNSVTTIGNYAFENCTSLTSVTIPDGVTTIGADAFCSCVSLTSITIPESVSSIGNEAFWECTSLESITVNQNNTYYSSDVTGVLYDKNQTVLIQYPVGNSGKTFTIPDSIISIKDCAFRYCTNLESITIPDSVSSIGEYAFRDCTNLKSINVDADNSDYSSKDGVLYDKEQTVLILYPAGNSEKTFTIPGSVTTIDDYAFRDCTNLESVTIPGSVTSIGYYGFRYCTNLESITVDENNTNYSSKDGVLYDKEQTVLIQYPSGNSRKIFSIPDGVTSIKDYAFRNCTNLESITISGSVTSVGDYNFRYCTNLESITVDENNTNYSSKDGVLYNKEQTVLIQYPIGNSNNAFTIPNSVTSIGLSAFRDCSNLENVTIPSSVKTIEAYAFRNCTNLESVTIPYSVSSIAHYAFRECTSLESIFLPDKELRILEGIPDTTSQVKYSLDETNVTITEINLADGMSTVDIPDTLCGYPVIAVAESEQAKVGAHTCKGGTATTTAKALCALCGNEYGELLADTDQNVTGGDVDAESPKTGDANRMALWIVLLFVSCGLLTVTGVYHKQKDCK
ncbi:MAG: leucine-rich repeat domain-containing protein [Lachnospira sp.]